LGVIEQRLKNGIICSLKTLPAGDDRKAGSLFKIIYKSSRIILYAQVMTIEAEYKLYKSLALRMN
jgi:hypothetical protein